ncbi:MAG: metallophosphoesterase, partial [Euryarchaeota archaeon]|nr:metallophosphoesterase [Euryarchaeota archaeon]
MEPLRIVHISDTHFGEELKPEKFKRAVKQINALEPELVILSGDIVTWGIHREFRNAYEALGEIEAELFIVPGNHDARNDGLKYFRLYFGEVKKSVKLDELVIAGVNSTLPDSDDGYVGEEQRRWVERKFRESCTNMLVLHHHVIPVPHTGRNRNVLIDAGEIVESLMLHCHGGIVLAGHRHVPYSTKLLRTHIIHAGTLSSYKVLMPDNNYNIIEFDGDSLTLKLRFIDHGEVEIGRFAIKRGMPEAIAKYHALCSTKRVLFIAREVERARRFASLFNRLSPENMHASVTTPENRRIDELIAGADRVIALEEFEKAHEVWRAEVGDREAERLVRVLVEKLLEN